MRSIQLIHSLPKDSQYSQINSPVDLLTLIGSHQGLHAILWESDFKNPKYKNLLGQLKKNKNLEIILKAEKQLSEYFSKQRKNFDLDLALYGTEFQKTAWAELRKIPYGQTISYGEQAKRMGDKNKARAVGMANGQNPISIIIPCHRVIGANGSLTGFGGGLDKKEFLLNLEKQPKIRR